MKNKTGLIIGATILVLGIGFLVRKKPKKTTSFDEESQSEVNQGSGVNSGSNAYVGTSQSVDTSKTTITKAQAKNYANALHQAFNVFWGTDNKAVGQVFDKITPDDYKMIHAEFGVRPRGGGLFSSATDLNLIGWLRAELGIADAGLKAKIRKVVEPAGFFL
jgi:hypothetical protein